MENRSFDRNRSGGGNQGGRSFGGGNRNGGGGRSFGGNNGPRREFGPADKLKQQLSEADMRVFIGNPKKFSVDLDKLPIIVIDSWKEGKEWIVIAKESFEATEHISHEVMTKQGFEITAVQHQDQGANWATYTIK